MCPVQLEGNKVVEAANSRFNALMVNQLEWQEVENGDGEKQIVSNMMLEARSRSSCLPVCCMAGSPSRLRSLAHSSFLPKSYSPSRNLAAALRRRSDAAG